MASLFSKEVGRDIAPDLAPYAQGGAAGLQDAKAYSSNMRRTRPATLPPRQPTQQTEPN
jgi:hypothetical protein